MKYIFVAFIFFGSVLMASQSGEIILKGKIVSFDKTVVKFLSIDGKTLLIPRKVLLTKELKTNTYLDVALTKSQLDQVKPGVP